MVVGVTPSSPAARAGLLRGDIIVAFDGKPATTTKDVLSRIGLDVGRPIAVRVLRGEEGGGGGGRKPVELELRSEAEAERAPAAPRRRRF